MTMQRDEGALLRESLRLAWHSLRESRLRSSLTLLGIVIGVATVIAMISVLAGLSRSVKEQISSLGSNVLYVSRYEAGVHVESGSDGRRDPLTVQDAEAVAALCPSVERVSPEVQQNAYARAAGRKTSFLTLYGATVDFVFVNDWELGEGRFFTAHETGHRSAVCVLGFEPAEELFPHGGSVGQWVEVDGRSYQVVGVLGKKGNFLGQSMDNLIVAPLPLVAAQAGYGDDVDHITVRPFGAGYVEPARDEMTELLRRRRGVKADAPDNFGITSQENLMDIYKRVTGAISLMTLVISSIGLLVGGIGVMNMMLVAVKERTREIGLRAALGARRRDILSQFLIEAIVLTTLGGVVGMLVGFALAFGAKLATGIQMAVTPISIVLALGLSIGVGLFFGWFPAFRASRLDPIEALRFE